MRPYPFKSPLKRWGMGCADVLGGGLRSLGFLGAFPRPSEGKNYRNVALIRLDHIGDLMFTLPALRAARRVFPNARLTLWAAPWAEDLVRPLRLVDEVKTFHAPWFERAGSPEGPRSAVGRFASLLSRGNYDLAVDFRGDFRHLLAAYRSGIRERVGYGNTGGGYLLTGEPAWDPSRHEVENGLELLRLFDPSLATYSMPSLTSGTESVDRIEALFRLAGWSWDLRPIVAQFAAGYPSKDWGDKKFAEALCRLADRGHRVALIGGEKDRARGDALVGLLGKKAVNWCGKTRLGDLPVLLGKALLYIGLDSGPSHMAVAMKTPSVLIYGRINDLGRWGPWTRGREERVRVIAGSAACGPCGQDRCPRPRQECLEDLPVGKVVRAARELLGRRPASQDWRWTRAMASARRWFV